MSTIKKSPSAHFHVRRVAYAALVAASVLLVTNVQAKDTSVHAKDVIPETTVRFEDLDLSKPQQAQVLYDRLKRAARSVCQQFDGRSAGESKRFTECHREALSTAVDRVSNNTLSALHAANPSMRVAQRRAQGTPAT